MRKFVVKLSLVALTGIIALAMVRAADEEKVPLDKLPKAVLDAVKAKFPKAQLLGAEKETVDGKVDLAATEALRKRIRQSELKESNALSIS